MSSLIYAKLSDIQEELKAPKSQFNSFGKYNYRSCEDIVEASKPICKKHGTVLLVSDTVKEVGGRVYVQALATLTCIEDDSIVSVTGWAREAEDRKGMDDSQITGATSSYARKYALNGLFAIDDTKDADTMKPREEKKESKEPERNWIAEIKTASTEEELKAVFGEAYKSTEGEEKAIVKREYDKRKVEITELGGSSQAQR